MTMIRTVCANSIGRRAAPFGTMRALWCACAMAIIALFAFSSPLAAQDIHTAALENNTDAIRTALENGANPNGFNLIGFSPLHSAARQGNVDMARLLVENGANVNIRTNTSSRDAPLHIATLNNHVAMVNFLLESGADPNIENGFGSTPFDNAAIVDTDRQTARLLVETGASADTLARLGYNAAGDPFNPSIIGSLSISTFFDIPFAADSDLYYGPFTPERILRDLFVQLTGQLLFALGPVFAIGAESGAAMAAAVVENYIHLEIPVRFVASLNASPSLSFQLLAGAHLMFPNLAVGSDAVFRFEGGGRVEFGRKGRIFVDLSYVLPFVIATGILSRDQFVAVTQSANSVRVGVGWRIRL